MTEEVPEFAVGDRVIGHTGYGARGFAGTVEKVGRTLIHVKHGREVRTYDKVTLRQRGGQGHIETVAAYQRRLHAMNIEARLRGFGISIDRDRRQDWTTERREDLIEVLSTWDWS